MWSDYRSGTDDAQTSVRASRGGPGLRTTASQSITGAVQNGGSHSNVDEVGAADLVFPNLDGIQSLNGSCASISVSRSQLGSSLASQKSSFFKGA